MSPQFYLGAILILSTILMDVIFKNYSGSLKKNSYKAKTPKAL